MKHFTLAMFVLVCMISCQTQKKEALVTVEANPAAEGFRLEQSDEKAIVLADQVMEAMGGRKAWDEVKGLQWTFFGRRTLLWDKPQERVRIEYPDKNLVIVTSLGETPEGKVWKDNELVTAPDSLNKYLGMGKSIWINDAYWLCMPFKLKDSGVALKYVREDTTQSGIEAEVLSLTFENVGDTPENKYEVWVEKNSHLITQWSYFSEAGQDSANFVTPWVDYVSYGNLKLSGNRGRGQLTDIRLLDNIDAAVFESPTMALPIQQ